MKRFWVLAAFAVFAAVSVQLATAADKFSCEGRASGYYADVDTGCQVYHMCDGLGRQFSYSCPNTTLFQQRMLICDHWYMVNCSKSEHDYSANLLIGQRDKPFVEDSFEHPYHRTPRPDLLQQPYAPRYQDDEYREGRSQNLPASLNLVGVATDEEEDENGNPRRNYTTDRPQYFLPSHWSTQYGKSLTTPLPIKVNVKSNKQNYGGKSSTGERKIPPPNFNYDPEYYKATKNTPSPVQKTTVVHRNTQENNPSRNPTLLTASSKNPVPPLPINHFPSRPVPINTVNSALPLIPAVKNNQLSNTSTKNPLPNLPIKNSFPPRPIPINTINPSLPLLPPSSPIKNNQNIKFSTINRADIGNIPDTINEASVSPSSLALPPFVSNIDRKDERPRQRPKPSNENIPKPSLFYQPPKFSSSFDIESTTMDPQTFYKLVPSKVLLPPIHPRKIESRSSTTVSSSTLPPPTITSRTINKKDTEQNKSTVDSDKRWKELRQMFFIPEYDFPLEVASRPSYEGGLSSFQVNSAPPNPEARFRESSGSASSSTGPNPDCPKCDPAFLAPGTCKPCVMIRR